MSALCSVGAEHMSALCSIGTEHMSALCSIGTDHMSACCSKEDLVMWTDILHCNREGVSHISCAGSHLI